MKRNNKPLWFSLLLLFFGIFLFSCTTQERKTKISTSSKDTTYLAYNNLSQEEVQTYFDTIITAGQFVRHPNDILVLSPSDSLFSKNDSLVPYYFEVFTKWMKGTDGYVSEGAGVAALDYLEANPSRFVKLLSAWKDTSVHAYSEWQGAIEREVEITHEGKSLQYLIALRSRLSNICKTEEDKRFISLFIKEMIESEAISAE